MMILSFLTRIDIQGIESAFPWKDIGAGSAALMVAALLVWVVKVLKEQHKDCADATAKISEKFAAVVEKQSEAFSISCSTQQSVFSQTTTKLVEDARVSHEHREERLHDLLRELRNLKRE